MSDPSLVIIVRDLAKSCAQGALFEAFLAHDPDVLNDDAPLSALLRQCVTDVGSAILDAFQACDLSLPASERTAMLDRIKVQHEAILAKAHKRTIDPVAP
jgi:hypothetical protein